MLADTAKVLLAGGLGKRLTVRNISLITTDIRRHPGGFRFCPAVWDCFFKRQSALANIPQLLFFLFYIKTGSFKQSYFFVVLIGNRYEV